MKVTVVTIAGPVSLDRARTIHLGLRLAGATEIRSAIEGDPQITGVFIRPEGAMRAQATLTTVIGQWPEEERPTVTVGEQQR